MYIVFRKQHSKTNSFRNIFLIATLILYYVRILLFAILTFYVFQSVVKHHERCWIWSYIE